MVGQHSVRRSVEPGIYSDKFRWMSEESKYYGRRESVEQMVSREDIDAIVQEEEDYRQTEMSGTRKGEM